MLDSSLTGVTALLAAIADGSFTPLEGSVALSPEQRELVKLLNTLHAERQEMLAGAHDRSRLIIDSTPVAICITNRFGLYEYMNPRYLRLTEYTREELIGNHFSMIVPEESQAELIHLHDEFMGQRYELAGHWTIRSRSGKKIPILANAAYVVEANGEPKKITFVIDISDLADANEALHREVEQRRRLEQVRDHVERIMQHDLRNPIDGIKTAAGFLLSEGEISGQALEFVRLMYDAAVRARSRIDSSLAYSQMEQGTYLLRRRRINVVQLVREVEEEVREHISAYRARVTALYGNAPLAEKYDVELWGEGDYIQDALVNLVRNALEASSAGDTVTLTVDEQSTPGFVLITVHNAADVPEQIRATFFEPYVTHGKAGGTGLGTYTARLVARAHGGMATMRTAEGSGTHVTLHLPQGRLGRDHDA